MVCSCSGYGPLYHQYFQWVDQHSGGSSSVSRRRDGVTQSVRPKFNDPDSIMGYFRGHMLPLYCQCRFVRQSEDQRFRQGFPVSGTYLFLHRSFSDFNFVKKIHCQILVILVICTHPHIPITFSLTVTEFARCCSQSLT